MKTIVVIGGGPAGMMAAGAASKNGISVLLLEKNEKLGKKLHITGKGRCNLTNDSDVDNHMSNVVSNPRFLHSAYWSMDSAALKTFFEIRGVPLKTERGGRVFPVSDKAYDINDALRAYLKTKGVQTKLNFEVKNIDYDGTRFMVSGITADAVIIATGGLSYPSTGSTGDGYKWAKEVGHTITPTCPALVPLVSSETWIPSLEGLSLKNVKCSLRMGSALIYEEIGEMMFTKTGITGPLVLSASAHLAGKTGVVSIDLKPGLTPDLLDARMLRDFETNKNKNFANALEGLLPQRLVETIIKLSQIPSDKKIHTISRKERQDLVCLLKNIEIPITGNAGYKEAVITKGGINTKELNPSTMMSKLIPGLFFAGEVLDVDALTGGYNMQIAFSTGHLAGVSAIKYIHERE